MKYLCTSLFLFLFLVSSISQSIRVETDKVVIPSGVKMGIGIDIPQTLLDVSGGIRINNSLIDKEGVLRYNNGVFEGYTDFGWKSLSTEVDGSTTNELISSITLSGNSLQINESGNIKVVNLSSFDGPLERNGTVVRQTGNYTTDDFIIGQDELPQPGQSYSNNLLFFDKSKGAFRSGRIQLSQNWADDSIGYRSVAFGHNTKAKGVNSMAIGQTSQALGADAFAMGYNTKAKGTRSASFGTSTLANGDDSFTQGRSTIAPSYAELALGQYNTSYAVESTLSWHEDDRLLTIGNGTSTVCKDALALWKNGQLGLGTSVPDARFHVEAESGEDAIEVYVNAQRQFYIPADGQVAIGDITNPDAKLYVESDGGEDLFRVRSDGSTKFKVNSNGGIRNSNASATKAFQLQNSATDLLGSAEAYSWNTYSDQRIKSNIKAISYGIHEVLSLAPKEYDHHDSEYFEDGRMNLKGKNKTRDIGLLAQELYNIIPEAVSKPKSENDLWSIDYTRLIPVLIKSIQQQQAMLNEMNEKFAQQQAEIDELRTMLLELNKE